MGHPVLPRKVLMHLPIPRFLVGRLLLTIPLLLGLLTLVFFLSRLLPGDPASLFVSPTIPPEVAEALRQQFGLDRPAGEQYLLWLQSALRGDLGFSFTHRAPVVDVLGRFFPNTLLLGGAAIVLEVLAAVGLAGLAASRPGSLADRIVNKMSLVVSTTPAFWVGMILLSVLSYGLGLFPSSQMYSVGMTGGSSTGDLLRHLALPAMTIAIPGTAGFLLYLRKTVQQTLVQDYVLAAKSMGLKNWKVFQSYVLPNAAGPFISLLGVEIGILFSGVLVTETLFAWPGMGRMTVAAIFARDYPLILGCTALAGVVVILGNLLADVARVLIDPRTRLP